MMGLAQWLLNLRILYNCYSIIGVRNFSVSVTLLSTFVIFLLHSYFLIRTFFLLDFLSLAPFSSFHSYLFPSFVRTFFSFVRIFPFFDL